MKIEDGEDERCFCTLALGCNGYALDCAMTENRDIMVWDGTVLSDVVHLRRWKIMDWRLLCQHNATFLNRMHHLDPVDYATLSKHFWAQLIPFVFLPRPIFCHSI